MLNKRLMAHGITLLALAVLLFLGLACTTTQVSDGRGVRNVLVIGRAPSSTQPAIVSQPTDSQPTAPTAPAVSSKWPGIAVMAIPGDLRSALNAGGVYVEAVYPGGAADTAGALQGDIITAVNDTPVSDVASFQAALQGAKRNGVLLTLYDGTKVRVKR